MEGYTETLEDVKKMEEIVEKIGQYLNEMNGIIAQVQSLNARFKQDRVTWDSEIVDRYYDAKSVLRGSFFDVKHATGVALVFLSEFVKEDQQLISGLHSHVQDHISKET